ncbi:MAG: hypothetical protein BWY72_02537 [Bacteroidetes bacterium ADurb.Bin416]|nr:MAG: hypothetical protein BWY72_02537 [Bacteroidetes bacterium ADurb.Bin416]
MRKSTSLSMASATAALTASVSMTLSSVSSEVMTPGSLINKLQGSSGGAIPNAAADWFTWSRYALNTCLSMCCWMSAVPLSREMVQSIFPLVNRR